MTIICVWKIKLFSITENLLFDNILSKTLIQNMGVYGLQPPRLLSPCNFSGKEYWSGLPFPLPGDLPDPEMEPESPVLAGRFFTTEPLGNPCLPPPL